MYLLTLLFYSSIDLPVVKWAEKILSRARQGGVTIPSPEERQKILGSTSTVIAAGGAVNGSKDSPAPTAWASMYDIYVWVHDNNTNIKKAQQMNEDLTQEHDSDQMVVVICAWCDIEKIALDQCYLVGGCIRTDGFTRCLSLVCVVHCGWLERERERSERKSILHCVNLIDPFHISFSPFLSTLCPLHLFLKNTTHWNNNGTW
jgi:hypothetical protein